MRLPVILVGELMAGMALGMAWPQLTAPPVPVPQTAMTAVTVPVPVPVAPVAVPTAIPVVRHAPRNPFGTPEGIDPRQQTHVAPAPAAPQPPTYVPPVSTGGSPAAPGVVTVPAPRLGNNDVADVR